MIVVPSPMNRSVLSAATRIYRLYAFHNFIYSNSNPNGHLTKVKKAISWCGICKSVILMAFMNAEVGLEPVFVQQAGLGNM